MPVLNFAPTPIEITQSEFDWIAKRMNTAPSGSVSFSSAAIRRYRKLTGQEAETAWKIRAQMIDNFGCRA